MTDQLIFKAINAVMNDIGAVKKGKKNTSQNFMFRGIDDVMNALNPALVKHKVFVVPEILEQAREERQTAKGGNLIYSICRIKYTFYAEDGSFVEAVTIGEGMDSGDKATNKAMAIAFKYACFQVFCIPTEEMKDPDEDAHEAGKEAQKPTQTKQEKPLADADQSGNDLVDQAKINTLQAEIERMGVAIETILGMFKIKDIKEMTTTMFIRVMKKFQATPDKKAGAKNE